MPPFFALVLTIAFIAALFARDARQESNSTSALWLPFLWVVIGSGSRFLSQWLNILGFQVGAINVEDGSPLDATYFLVLILLGMYVLFRRRVNCTVFVRNNPWIFLYFSYCFLAILWSDFPYVAFKRWIKLMGDPVMVLILLTEPDPAESLIRLMKRCAYIMLPVSICFIKYFPALGRGYDAWTGVPHYTGIATNKNELGFDCWILGTVLFWRLLQVLQWERGRARRNELFLCGGLLLMNLWLLHKAQSATSLVAFLLGAAVLLFLGFRWVNPWRVGAYIAAGIIVCLVAGFGFGLFDDAIHLLGRNDTLTGRTAIWQALWHWNINPIVGTGFESFWLGPRLDQVRQILPFLNEAHNGYLETYLNLGFIGVGLVAAMLLATYVKARRALFGNFEWGRFRLAFLLAFIVYNWTEAAFRLNAFPFFMFFVIALDYPASVSSTECQTSELYHSESDFEPVPVSAGE